MSVRVSKAFGIVFQDSGIMSVSKATINVLSQPQLSVSKALAIPLLDSDAMGLSKLIPIVLHDPGALAISKMMYVVVVDHNDLSPEPLFVPRRRPMWITL